VNVADVAATPPAGRSEALLRWAASAWADWSPHHERLRAWLADALSHRSGTV